MTGYGSWRRPRYGLLLIGLALAPRFADAEVFGFKWPSPATASVKAAIAKEGNASTVRYGIELEARADGEYVLTFRNFEFLTLNGVDARDPKVVARLGPLAALTASLPATRVSARGEFLGTLGLMQMMDRILETLPEGMDSATRDRLDQYFRSTQVQSMMQQKSGETWNGWVGAWNGLDLNAGQILRAKVPISVMNRELEQQLVVEHLGSEAQTPGCATCVRLRMTTTVEGPEVLALVSGIIRELAATAEPGAADPFVSARSTSTTEVVTDPATLMLRYAISNSEVALTNANDETHSRHERKEYWFEWN